MTDELTSFEERRGTVRYLQALRRHILLITAIVGLATLGAAAYSQTATKVYKASADVSIDPVESDDPTFRAMSVFRDTAEGSPVVVATRVLRGRDVYREAYERMGAVGKDVSVALDPLPQTNVVLVTASGPDPDRVARAANIFARTAVEMRTDIFQRELTERIAHLKRQRDAIPVSAREGNFEYAALAQQIGELRSFLGLPDPTLRVLNEAVPPSRASWPRPVLSVFVSLFASLLFGAALAIALELVNARVADEDELRLIHRLPILARVPRLPDRVARGYLTGRALLPSEAWKGYRTMRAVLANVGPQGGFPRSVVVTSASPGDGKTMTAVNLAITLAASNMRVVLIDGDFHRPMVASIFNVTTQRDGLTRMLSGGEPAKTALVPAPTHPGLQLLLSNPEQTHMLHLLETDRFRRLLVALESFCDIVVVDSPPLPEVAEALAMAEAADVVLLTVRLGHTRREKLVQLRELLVRRAVSPLGFLVTTRDRSQSGGNGYEYSGEIATTPTDSGLRVGRARSGAHSAQG